MLKQNMPNNGIPISISLQQVLEPEKQGKEVQNKKRIIQISFYAICIAAATSVIARALIYLINLVVNISFHDKFSMAPATPMGYTHGLFIIFVPAIGGVIVGLMAYYGSMAIRGHGIPEAMEQILTNQSKISPAITYLKPLSSAIAIGTGGPFGAEGPIIATGGALGSTLGQILKITHNERKILLAAGATAGMAAIFGSPVAAIFLAIELLLFEFSPRSVIPVALACITGAAGHHLLFGTGPVFPVPHTIEIPGNTALFFYSLLGIGMGVISVFVSKIVYFIEDAFEHLPIHWMWWPAIGGLFVGLIGYFAPRTLGVGYENITDVLTGSLTVKVMIFLSVLKFASWAIALGSGTSGGTLAPLLTIGGATGALAGSFIIYLFPNSGVTVTLAALAGMSAMFAGASRALITSIIFAMETTGQANALLTLLASCTGSYLVSFFMMENTIMTEKIARRGVKTPDSFSPDLLGTISVSEVLGNNWLAFDEEKNINEVRQWLHENNEHNDNYIIIVSKDNEFVGIVPPDMIFKTEHGGNESIASLAGKKASPINVDATLKEAISMMVKEGAEVLPVVGAAGNITGVLSYSNILSAYKTDEANYHGRSPVFSLKRQAMKVMVKAKRK